MESNKQKFYQKSSFYIAIFTCLVLLAAVLIFILVNNNNTAAVSNPVSNEQGTDVDNADATNQAGNNQPKVVEVDETMDVDGAVAANAPEIKNLSMPVAGTVIYSFRKPITDLTDNKNKTPRGVGVETDVDSEVKASGDGVIEYVGSDRMFGNIVVINHDDSYKTVYGNLKDEISVSVGDEIKAGEVLGTIGDSAVYFVNTHYNPHLHFEVIASNKSYEDIMTNYNDNYDSFQNPEDFVEFKK